MNNFGKQLLQWPPTSTSVIGAGLILGIVSYWLTGSWEVAGIVAGAFKILCPQDAPATDQVLSALGQLDKVIPIRRAGMAIAFGLALGLTTLGLVACSADQVQKTEATMTDFQGKIAAACRLAMPLAAVPYVGMYIAAGCGTEQAIATLALDPTSLEWVNQLIVQAKRLAANDNRDGLL